MSGSAPDADLEPQRVAHHLHVQVAEFGTPQRAAAERSYLKSQLRHLGAPVPAVRRVVRNWVRRHPQVGHDDLFAIADALWAEPVHELRLAAIELLQAVPRRVDADDMPWERAPLEKLSSEGHLKAFRHLGFWQCMDTLRDKILLEELWKKGDAPWKRWS